MPSEVDICNLALSRIGDEASVVSIDPPEGSIQAEHCASFYPVARNALLELHPWNFAVKKQSLASLGDGWDGWTYAYGMPPDFVLAINISGDAEFSIELNDSGNRVMLCNIENPDFRYVTSSVDPSKFSPLFVTTLSWLLASMLAGPILKGDVGAAEAKRCEQAALQYLTMARGADAQSRKMNPKATHRPAWIRGR